MNLLLSDMNEEISITAFALDDITKKPKNSEGTVNVNELKIERLAMHVAKPLSLKVSNNYINVLGS